MLNRTALRIKESLCLVIKKTFVEDNFGVIIIASKEVNCDEKKHIC
jgi:hypothetical protein